MGNSHFPRHFSKLLNAIIEGPGDDYSVNFTFENYIFKPVHQFHLITTAPSGLKPISSELLNPILLCAQEITTTRQSVRKDSLLSVHPVHSRKRGFLESSISFVSCHFVSTKFVHLSQGREVMSVSYQTTTQPVMGHVRG